MHVSSVLVVGTGDTKSGELEYVKSVIESSGEDFESGDGELRNWWYQVRFDGTEPIRGIEIRNEILYEQFRDQRNIVRVLHVPTETRKTLYFAAPDGGWTEVAW